MRMEAQSLRRQQRRAELKQMWREKRGQSQVLSLFRRALPDNQEPSVGMCVFDVILDHEFGTSEESPA
ncbi:MAG: hypothetical protein KY475_07395 [Planctomycetes bacterium]|nr:hypothetical protein [Planctomycetota bacterium]